MTGNHHHHHHHHHRRHDHDHYNDHVIMTIITIVSCFPILTHKLDLL
jgi:hypothetical protein